jgi:hypothetical protein
LKQVAYILDYSTPSGTVKLDKYDIPLPVKPPVEEMVNYGLPIAEQKFKRTIVPRSLLRKKNNLTFEEEAFIQQEYHKRKNGVWMLIKGEPVYLTGPYYAFLNYWWTKNGTQPDFRYTQSLIFLFWDMVVRDTNAYGMKLVKPRRIGGTEMTLFILWEYATRVRNVVCGMQSKNEETVYKNFKRLTYGNKRVLWFMRPIQKGSEDPQDILEFRYPSKLNTNKAMREQADTGTETESMFTEVEMNSAIDYRACEPLAYDGEELNRYTLNESGKLEHMSLLDCWDKVKPCLHYFDGAQIVGKAIFESTIEELDDKQIEEVNTFVKIATPTYVMVTAER